MRKTLPARVDERRVPRRKVLKVSDPRVSARPARPPAARHGVVGMISELSMTAARDRDRERVRRASGFGLCPRRQQQHSPVCTYPLVSRLMRTSV